MVLDLVIGIDIEVENDNFNNNLGHFEENKKMFEDMVSKNLRILDHYDYALEKNLEKDQVVLVVSEKAKVLGV